MEVIAITQKPSMSSNLRYKLSTLHVNHQFIAFSRTFNFQRLKEKLVRADSVGGRGPFYGATNQAFTSDDVLTPRHYKQPSLLEIFEEPVVTVPPIDSGPEDNIIADDAPGDERESWDSKMTFILATIG